jgi:hypothetical protein
MKQQLGKLPNVEVLGDPLFVIAFRSETLNVYQILQAMADRGWILNGLHLPPSVHLCVTLRHTEPGVKEAWLEDLQASIEAVRRDPRAPEGVGPVYGLAATVETRGMVKEILDWYMDTLYDV